MTWYLLFCVSMGYQRGNVECHAPVRMPDEAHCKFVGNAMQQNARAVGGNVSASTRCISVKKPL